MEPVTGRRGKVVDNALLTAALAELIETGYVNLTLEQVAHRAGVHKTTIYRRWTSKEALVGDAAVQLTAEEFVIPDTGDIDRDVRAAARARVAWFTSEQGRAFVELLSCDVARLPEARDTITRLLGQRRPMVEARLQAATASGQLPTEVDPGLFLSTLVAPLYLSLLVTRQPLTPAHGDHAAAVALAAARAGALSAPVSQDG